MTLPTHEPSPTSRHLGEILIERKVLSRDALEDLLAREVAEETSLSQLLLGESLVGEKDLVAAVAEQVGTEFIDLQQTPLNPTLERVLPPDLARKYLAVAVRVEDGRLLVAMADPTNTDAVDALKVAASYPIKAVLGARSDLARAVIAIHGQPESDSEDNKSEQSPVLTTDDREERPHVNELLERVVDLGGSDLHITVGIPPSVRVHGDIKALTEYGDLNGSQIRRMIYGILNKKQRQRFEEDLELDTSHSVPGVGRFRVNVFVQRDSVGAVMRVIPHEIHSLEDLGMPPIVSSFADLPRGLVLVTGPTGSGKSTTLASIVDLVNSTRPVHIMTVEDPIEFLHNHKQAVVNQREVGEDTRSFSDALKHVLRQDPDVILVGEMRDLETMSTALTAAETGHLVFGTLHTQDAPQSVDRIIDVFPAYQQQHVRSQLGSSLQAVVTQQLIPTAKGRGRAAATEILVATPAVRNLIREGKTHQISSAMQAGAKHGMQTMDQSLASLVRKGTISMQHAIERCSSEDELRRLSSGS